MNKSIILLGFLFGMFLPAITKGQTDSYVGHYTEKDNIKHDTLIDVKSGNKFIVDKQRIFIKAINKDGKLLWKTDPFMDNKLESYRVKRPTIVYFTFDTNRATDEQVIAISYNNSQSGYIDKKTNKFIFR